MNGGRLIVRGICFYWRSHAGVLLGTVLASAVLTGALLVGDSVDYSLRKFATMRLDGIHHAVDTQTRFFSESLADVVGKEINAPVAAALHVRGMAIVREKQVNRVHVIGVRPDFWTFARGAGVTLAGNEMAVNRKLAAALDIDEGDEISLRIGKPSLMSRDALLSSQGEEFTIRSRMSVKSVLTDDQLGRFSLAVSQTIPYNAFVDIEWLRDQVDLDGRANVMVAGDAVDDEHVADALTETWRPEHIGLRVRRYGTDIVQLETDQVFLDTITTQVAMNVPGATGTLAYLVNSISSDRGSTPYSFVVAGPVPDGMSDNEMVVNRWLADQIDVGAGDRIEMTYYELLPSNKVKERARTFTVHSVREMEGLQVERDLMPVFPGLSDVESCSDWDVGMPMDEELLADEANEMYWQEFGQTPKAFVTLDAGREMWANRFGDLTGVRYAATADIENSIVDALVNGIDPATVGLVFQPVHDHALEAVSQSMDFGQLFLGMSFFLIVAALILTSLLCVFGIQQRAGEMGALAAMGYSRNRVRAVFFCEIGAVAAIGAVLGACLGTVYTRTLIAGLDRFWSDAVAGSAISYHAEPGTIGIGMAASFVCAATALVISMWRQTKRAPVQLLSGNVSPVYGSAVEGRRRELSLVLSIVGVMLAVAAIVYVQTAEPDDIVTPFFGAGSMLLISGLGFMRYALSRIEYGSADREPTFLFMSVQNVARRQGRSLTTVALLACGCFMVFAVSSMHEDIAAHADKPWSGTGGFDLFGESTLPIIEKMERGAVNIKVRDGDDASCLNLSRANTPRVLGVNVAELSARRAFLAKDDGENVWNLLNVELPDGAVPAFVGDTDTALWGLKKKVGVKTGDTLVYRDGLGKEVNVKLVGRLPMRLSVFQGTILVSDKTFSEMYPNEDGYRMFLIDGDDEFAASLTRRFERAGLDVVPAVRRLHEFYAVEQTYLAMFLVLGGLGLALGSAGMGIVALRNLLERRGELAMLQALGYNAAAVHKMLITEHGLLFATGMCVGIISASVAMFPAVFSTDSRVSWRVQTFLAALVITVCTTAITVAIRSGFQKNDLSALRNE